MEHYKVKCTIADNEWGTVFTVGKIYAITNKGLKNDKGHIYTAFVKDWTKSTLLEDWLQWANIDERLKFKAVYATPWRF
jgi:hypothetical protein